MCRFLTLGAVTGGTLPKVFVKGVPRFHAPAFPKASSARTRQWYVLSRRSDVGECEVAMIVPLQHTFEPGEKSAVGLTSSSYLAAPDTGFHENNGSKTSVSLT